MIVKREKTMKKMMILTAASALLCTFLTGCTVNISDDTISTATDIAVSALDNADINVNGQQVDISLDSNGDINVNLAQTTVASDQTTNNSAAETQTVLSNAEMKGISKQLIQEYVTIYNGILSGWITTDETDEYASDPGYPYYRVVDPKLRSIADVKSFMAKTLTGTEYDKLVGYIWGDSIPVYIERNGKLYALSVGRGSAYSDTWQWDQLQFTNVTADSFTVKGQYYHMGDALYSQAFDIIRTAEGFRISNAAEVEINDNHEAENNGSGSYENPFDEYIGQWRSEVQWNGSDYYIQITRDREIINVEVSAHSAVADYQWNYTCLCSEDGTYIECTNGGTLKRTDYAPNGDVQEPVTVYSDGSAKFNIKGGTLFWEDCKEGTARQVGFSKIG